MPIEIHPLRRQVHTDGPPCPSVVNNGCCSVRHSSGGRDGEEQDDQQPPVGFATSKTPRTSPHHRNNKRKATGARGEVPQRRNPPWPVALLPLLLVAGPPMRLGDALSAGGVPPRSSASVRTLIVDNLSVSRRSWMRSELLKSAAAVCGAWVPTRTSGPSFANANAAIDDNSEDRRVAAFRTLAYGRAEYTNSITASRDTNLSPREAYDVIRERIPRNRFGLRGRALDVGAGAGLSTAVLYVERGYRAIDAVDWSADAWSQNVLEPLPETVRWYESDDDSFPSSVATPKSYRVIVYNFAINPDKADRVARNYLVEDGGLLLAPVNDRADYWYKQSYRLLDASGAVVWRSDPEVGAWSVQFQPDVTADTCTGIWCGGFNGYQQQLQQQQRRQK